MDVPVEPMWKDSQQYDECSSTETPTYPEAQHIFNELRTNRHMDQDLRSSTKSIMEVQLNWLVKAINDANNATKKEMNKSVQEGFTEVRTKLDSVYDIVSKRAPESMIVQENVSISTEPRARNVQILSTYIDVRSEELNTSL